MKWTPRRCRTPRWRNARLGKLRATAVLPQAQIYHSASSAWLDKKRGKNQGPVLPDQYANLSANDKQARAEDIVGQAMRDAVAAHEQAKSVHDELLYDRLYDDQQEYEEITTASNKTFAGQRNRRRATNAVSIGSTMRLRSTC